MRNCCTEFTELFQSSRGILSDPIRQRTGLFWSAIFGLSGFALCGEGVLIKLAVDYSLDEANEDIWSIAFTILGSILLFLAVFLGMRSKCGELWLESNPIGIRIGLIMSFVGVGLAGTSGLWVGISTAIGPIQLVLAVVLSVVGIQMAGKKAKQNPQYSSLAPGREQFDRLYGEAANPIDTGSVVAIQIDDDTDSVRHENSTISVRNNRRNDNQESSFVVSTPSEASASDEGEDR